ncbi:MAG: hypothetical protein NVSMB25_21720 [Thermoleophilaceae bacterium]
MTAEPIFERGRRLTLGSGSRAAASVGELVLVGQGKRGPRVIRSIGRPDVARDVLEGLMLDRGLWRAFPRAVEAEAEECARTPAWDGGRTDLTALPTFTVDPRSARDFDDAISAQRLGDIVRVYVHIADVSAYVRPGSAIERETLRRATSVYVPGAVEPMLPPALSNDACSLVPNLVRPAVSVVIDLAGADVTGLRFHRSLIRSDVRLTYERVDRLFGGIERAEDPWGEPLETARAVAEALRERRAVRGSLAVESSEPSFEFDAGGNVTGVLREQQSESHALIEELMILANEQVAGLLADRRRPTIFRVHERPEPQAVVALAEKLESLDVPTPPLPKQMSPQQAADAIGEISRIGAQHVRRAGRGSGALTSLVLRSLKQAFYSPRNIGHAGLASPRYLHFTSPIRRYPDLVAHRALLAATGADDVAPRADELEEAAVHSSTAEREAMQIERDADDVCLAFLLERRLADAGHDLRFEGEVVGLVGGGAFVRFGGEGFEGFLPARALRGEWWDLNELGTALVGARSGATVRLGDPVSIAVHRVETARGRVDLLPGN